MKDVTWEPYKQFNGSVIKDYLQLNGLYDYEWKHRCPRCDKPCRSERGVKIHFSRVCKQYEEEQQFCGTVAQRLHEDKVKELRQTTLRPVVDCETKPLKNCYIFKYLGSMFTADGDEEKDVKRRVAMAVSRFGQLRHVLGSKHVKQETKLRIYKCAVGSLFTYGSEAWNLNEKCVRTLNGANASCLFRFTGKTRVEESRHSTCTYSMAKDIRRRRLIWLGHLLRMDDNRLVKRAVKVQWSMREKDNLFCDAPNNLSFTRLCVMAKSRTAWRGLVNTMQRDNVKMWNKRPESVHTCKLRSDKPTTLTSKTNHIYLSVNSYFDYDSPTLPDMSIRYHPTLNP